MIKKLISLLLTVALTLSIVTVVAPTAEADTLPNYVKFEGTEEFTIQVAKYSSAPVVNLQYSTDGTQWTNYNNSTRPAISSGENKVLYFRGTNDRLSTNLAGYNYFVITPSNSGTVAASGNIMALLNYSSPATTLGSTNYNAFNYLFKNCTALTSAPSLPATTMSAYCYLGMFDGCTGLAKAPELPAKTLANRCYTSMFKGCTGLIEAPELPAETLTEYCYNGMFYGCTGLTKAPELPAETLANNCCSSMFFGCTGLIEAPELPAETLANYCYYQMFKGCTGLTKAPELPAETLADYCYYAMFSGCTGLTKAPELPAKTLAKSCYNSMFNNCTGLTKAPELPVETLAGSCYAVMFAGCTGLTEAPELPAKTLATSCYNRMFDGCTGLTEAPELPAETLADLCCGGMFRGCTGLTEAPELPVETLTNNCYTGMFAGCTGLTKAPELPAETLTNNCYSSMFSGCTGLTEAPELPAKTLAQSCYFGMFSGCTSLTSAPELKATTLANKCYYRMFNGCTNLKMEETTDSSKALWVMPSSTEATDWNKDMLTGTAGTATSVELNKMYRITPPYPYMVGETKYESAADLNADIADGTVEEGSTIVLTGEKPDGTIVLDGKDMTIDGSALDAIVLPDNGVLASVTGKARVNVLGTMPATAKDNTADAPIYSEGFIYLGASASSKTLTTTGSVYQAKTVAEFMTAGATLTEVISLAVSAEVAPKTGDVIAIAAKEGTAGATTFNQATGYYEATINGIYLSHVGNDLGLSVKANDTAAETVEDYTTVNYLSDAATAEGENAPTAATKTLIANLIIACKNINDAGKGNKGDDIDLTDSELSWIDDAKTTDAPATKSMTISALKDSDKIRFSGAGLHVTEKLNVFVMIEPRKGATTVPKGTYIKAYINDGNGYEEIDAVDATVYLQDRTQWYAYIDKIAPTQYGSDIKIELYTDNDVLTQTLTYSVNTYCSQMSSTYADLCTAIYNYGTAAKAVAAEQ